MYIILRDKYIFNIIKRTQDNNWIYLSGKCLELTNRETIICLENTVKNRNRIIDNT